MRRIATAIGILSLMLVPAARAQSSVVNPAEIKKWGLWIGDWTMAGTAKDSPSEPEYKVEWRTRVHWVLSGAAVQADHSWKGNGPEEHWLEILSYDPARKIHTFFGFASEGTTWVGTATFQGRTSVETMQMTSLEGKVAKCRNTWMFSADRTAISAKQECEQDGVRWGSFTVKGTRTKAN